MSLTIENSWHSSGGLWQDPDLERVRRSPLQYQPKPFELSELVMDTLWTLRGPRRSGKTVTLKLLIAEFIEKHNVPAAEIIWTSVETLRNASQLDLHLRQLIDHHKPLYFFCDEITNIHGWQNVIKKIRDQGLLRKTCTILTGSSSFDLKKGSERLAGRKGSFQSTDRVLLPMCFSDFQKQDQNLLAQDYLISGGFPFRVEEFLLSRKEKRSFDPLFGMSVFDDVFFYEFNRRKLDRNIALEVLFRLSQTQPHAVSYSGFAKALNVKMETAQKYLDVLGDAFLLATICSYDTGKSRVALKKDRKFIWADPALTYLAHGLGQGLMPTMDSIAEQTVGLHLIRQFELRLFEGLSSPRQVFTWKSKNGNEIDFLIVNRAKKLTFPVEVKFQNEITSSDFQSIEKAFGQGIVVSKKTSVDREKSRAFTMDTFLKQKAEEIISK